MTTDYVTEQGLPHSLEAERCILGAIILENESIYSVLDFLSPSDFYAQHYGELFRLLALWISDSQAVDLVLIKEKLRDRISEFGGISEIASLIDVVPNARNIEHYAQVVKQKSSYRRLITGSFETIRQCYEGDDLERALQHADSVASGAGLQKADTVKSSQQLAKEQIEFYDSQREHPENTAGIPTGLVDLDQILSGLHKTDLIILAARPKQGKTALACTILNNAAERDYKVFVASIEQNRFQFNNRIIARRGKIDGFHLHSGRLDPASWKSAYSQAMNLGKLSYWMDDSGSQSLNHIRATAKKLKTTGGLDLVIVDYIGLVKHSPARNVIVKRHEIVAEISHGLKALAKDLNVAVLCLAQLNREVEEFKQPELHQLRESGDIEQDADVVLFLWKKLVKRRSENGQATGGETHNMITVAKQRNGPEGTIRVYFKPEHTAFFDFQSEENYAAR